MDISELIKNLDMNKVQAMMNTPKGREVIRQIEREFGKGDRR